MFPGTELFRLLESLRQRPMTDEERAGSFFEGLWTPTCHARLREFAHHRVVTYRCGCSGLPVLEARLADGSPVDSSDSDGCD